MQDNFMKAAILSSVVLAGSALEASAQGTIAAPSGEPAVVAQRVIHENFDKVHCPSVVKAIRVGGGTIKAFCNNGTSFRIFHLDGKAAALNCSAAATLGVKGC